MCSIFWNEGIVRFLMFDKFSPLCTDTYNLIIIYSAFVDQNKIELYAQNRSKFLTKGKGSSFKDAVKQIDEYISNPMV